ncbi:MAG TPA: hypothetical protein VFN83_07075 [Gemmatimonadales bacterium]|jgi:hypothetical protein|nr:hypothetical protein [Gemmatimonadales bacterium]
MNSDDLLAARRDAVHALCVAQAREQLSVEAFEHRLELLREAPTAAAVRQIIGDLEPTGDYAVQPYAEPALPVPAAPLERMRVSATFSQAVRNGRWTVPLLTEARAVFGEVRLDLRDAWFDTDVVEIAAHVMCGKLAVIVPPGTQVENEASALFAGTEHKRRRAAGADWNGLLVRITGRVFMGAIEIIERPSTSDMPQGHYDGMRGAFNRWRDGVS